MERKFRPSEYDLKYEAETHGQVILGLIGVGMNAAVILYYFVSTLSQPSHIKPPSFKSTFISGQGSGVVLPDNSESSVKVVWNQR